MSPVERLADRVDQFVVGKILFPASNYLLNRKNILGRYREMLRTERLPREALRELQFERLCAVIRRAYTGSAFYAKRFREAGLTPADIRSIEDFRHVPRLLRKDLAEHGSELVDARFRDAVAAGDARADGHGAPLTFAAFRRHRLVRNTSSGSTGTPTVFYEDGSTTALSWAHELRLKQWFGLAPGAKEARMSATAAEFAAQGKLARTREWLWNQMVLPGYFLSDREYEACTEQIRKFRPRILWGPTPALVGVAQYTRRKNLDLSECFPSLVISRAAPLYASDKKLLEDVFNCPAANIYGTREVGHVAMTCPQGSMHLNEENYLVEVEHHGMDASEGASGAGVPRFGRVLVTPLYESPMPFLRYDIGDLAEFGESDCACGRTLVTFKKILGREGDVFRTSDGHCIEPNFWCIAFEDGRPSRDVEKYQVVYRRSDTILIRIVARPSYSNETEAELRRFLAANVPAGIQFEFECVADIPPKPSGKCPTVVNEMDQQTAQALLR